MITKPYILAAGLFAGVLAIAIAMSLPAQSQTPAQREATLLADYRARPDPFALEELALVREEKRDLSGAIATWNLMRKQFGSLPSPTRALNADDTSKALTYGELANWTIRRLQRKRQLANRPTTLAQKQRAARAYAQFLRSPPVNYPVSSADVDLDGDGIPEIALFNKSWTVPKTEPNRVSVYKWDGQTSFRPLWTAQTREPFDVEFGRGEYDELNDGFAEIFVAYSRAQSDLTTLQFNGDSFIAVG